MIPYRVELRDNSKAGRITHKIPGECSLQAVRPDTVS